MNDVSNGRSRRVLIVTAVIVAAAVGGAATLSALRTTPELDAATPEGVVQAYYQAVVDGREEDAWALVTPELQERCDEDAFRFYPAADTVRVVLVSTEVRGGRAAVEVEIDRILDPSPFDLDLSNSTRERLELTRSGRGWLISELPRSIFCEEGS